MSWSWFSGVSTLELLVAGGLLGVAVARGLGWRAATAGTATFFALRLLAFENPAVWSVYQTRLDPETVGWRQASVLQDERQASDAVSEHARFLAVGSSQTGVIWSDFAAVHDGFDVYSIAAMAPLDFVLYRERILERRPETVLLYLSEFDLAQWLSEEAVVMAPRQGWDLAGVWAEVAALPGGARYHGSMAQLLAGELSPEIKHGFALRGALEKLMGRVARRVGREATAPERASIEQRIGWLRETMVEDAVAFNLALLDRFFAELERAGVEVVVVGGSYRPDVLDDRLWALRERVDRELLSLADRHPSVELLARERVMPLAIDDFRDLTHVTAETGAELAFRVARSLDVEPVTTRSQAKDQEWWREQVEAQAEEVRRTPGAQVVLVGDSITEGWSAAGSPAWSRRFPDLSTLNLGVGADRTEHVLWRLEHLPRGALRPRVAVVMIGTNNASVPGHSAPEIAAGVRAVVDAVQRLFPDARILLLGITPRDVPESPLRAKIARVNAEIEGMASPQDIRYLDLGPRLVDADGRIDRAVMPDLLHPSALGYEILAEGIAPVLAELLR